jgi:signal transduction histidine kinase
MRVRVKAGGQSTAGQGMVRDMSPWRAVTELVARFYLILIVGLGLVVVTFESREHLFGIRHDERLSYLMEVTFGLLLLACMAVLSRQLRAAVERSRAARALQARQELGLYLAQCADAGDLSARLLERLTSLAPQARLSLYLSAAPGGWFVPAPGLAPAATERFPAFPLHSDLCQACLALGRPAILPLAACRQPRRSLPPGQRGYCVPLAPGGPVAGLLQIYTPDDHGLSSAQVDLLEGVSAVAGTALTNAAAHERRTRLQVAQKERSLQAELARDLHDTVGQNITYLRLRLAQLADGNEAAPLGASERRQLLQLADEAFEVVRGMLAVLYSNGQADLVRLIQRYADQVEDRSSLRVTYTARGEPAPLAPPAARQVFLACREALNNIEKHASATEVVIELDWRPGLLELVVADDGQGFDPALAPAGTHYGLQFMRERMALVQGSVTLDSAPGRGTRLVLRLPVEPHPGDRTGGLSAADDPGDDS